MGRGTSKAGGGSGGGAIGSHAIPGQPNVQTSGDISYQDMMAIAGSSLSDGTIAFNKVTTVMANGYMPITGKKSELGTMLNDTGMKRMVVNMYRDKSGANDLKRLQNLGFKIQAKYTAPDTGSSIPPRDYYFMVKQ